MCNYGLFSVLVPVFFLLPVVSIPIGFEATEGSAMRPLSDHIKCFSLHGRQVGAANSFLWMKKASFVSISFEHRDQTLPLYSIIKKISIDIHAIPSSIAS